MSKNYYKTSVISGLALISLLVILPEKSALAGPSKFRAPSKRSPVKATPPKPKPVIRPPVNHGAGNPLSFHSSSRSLSSSHRGVTPGRAAPAASSRAATTPGHAAATPAGSPKKPQGPMAAAHPAGQAPASAQSGKIQHLYDKKGNHVGTVVKTHDNGQVTRSVYKAKADGTLGEHVGTQTYAKGKGSELAGGKTKLDGVHRVDTHGMEMEGGNLKKNASGEFVAGERSKLQFAGKDGKMASGKTVENPNQNLDQKRADRKAQRTEGKAAAAERKAASGADASGSAAVGDRRRDDPDAGYNPNNGGGGMDSMQGMMMMQQGMGMLPQMTQMGSQGNQNQDMGGGSGSYPAEAAPVYGAPAPAGVNTGAYNNNSGTPMGSLRPPGE